MCPARSVLEHHSVLLVGNRVTASDVEHVVKGAIPLHPKAAFFVTGWLGGADSRGVGSSAGRWVGIWGSPQSNRCEGCDEEGLHV